MDATGGEPEWDAANGVYRGNRAAGADGELPKGDLVIFGYGSLVWRPEPEWAAFERFDCTLHGWLRAFAQRSMDHRGTPEFPGLVATVLPVTDALAAGVAGGKTENLPEERTRVRGTGYVVPEAQRANVLGQLDFREKGGYMRAVVEVERSRDGATLPALVYTGTTSNPNFDKAALADARVAAARIARAVGPSGRNDEYLSMLVTALPDDAYLAELAHLVVQAQRGVDPS